MTAKKKEVNMFSISELLRRSLLLIAAIGLAGCGSSYKVAHVHPKGDVPRYLPEEGIYYSLPKTQIVLRIPITHTLTEHSKFSYKFNEMVESCRNSGQPGWPDKVENPVTELKAGEVAIFTRAVPDPLHRYRLDVSAGTFSSFTHTIKVTDASILTNVDTTVKDARTASRNRNNWKPQ
jgi:hypothetical protein